MSAPSGAVHDSVTAFRVLARALETDGRFIPAAVVLLDFAGKALGIGPEHRRRLARRPASWCPDQDGLGAVLEPFLSDAPAEIQEDVLLALRDFFQDAADPSRTPPVCPRCKPRAGTGAVLLWEPSEQSGLGPLESTRHSSWSCQACHSLLECVDEFDGTHRSRQLRTLVPGAEIHSFIQSLEDADPDTAAKVLASGPAPPWLLEKISAVAKKVRRVFGIERDRLSGCPEATVEAYEKPESLARLGPPPGPENWRALLRAECPVGLLGTLAALPGAPDDVRRALFRHPDPEVRYQAYQAPDVPYELLEEVLRSGATSAVLAVLDRTDVGGQTLALALARGDPHVVYRACRHPSLDLLLLEQARKVRRSTSPRPLDPSRTIQIYAPMDGRPTRHLLDEIARVLTERLPLEGWRLASVDRRPEDPAAIEVHVARVTQSRAILFLPEAPDAPDTDDIRRERLFEDLARGLLGGLAAEVLSLHVDEASGFWNGRILRVEGPPQRTGGHGLRPDEAEGEAGRWLEFELFCAERALPYPGVPWNQPTPRLETRPPYAGADELKEERCRLYLVAAEEDPESS